MEIISPVRWLRSLTLPWLVAAAFAALLAAAGVEPTDGGWPPVLIVAGCGLLLWSALVGLGLPNRLDVTPERIVRRVRWTRTVVRREDVSGAEVTPLGLDGFRVRICSPQASVTIGVGSGPRSAPARQALRPYVQGIAMPAPARAARTGRSAPALRVAVAVSGAVTAAVAVLRVVT